MKVFAAALPLLVLAAALGRPTHGWQPDELGSATHVQNNFGIQYEEGGHASDCCFSYATRNIRCVFMQNYYETSSKCSQPAVIFKTRTGREVCFHPGAVGVRECMVKLDSANTWKTAG